jgi:rfaE bifunctional protein kinase chain/domain
MTPERARELLDASRGKQVLLVGDLMMDEWVVGSVKRISPEAPIPVVAMPLDKDARTYKPGGAGNVAAILLGLGARLRVLGVVGDDVFGERLLADLRSRGADVSGVLKDPHRPTSHKMRILAGRQQLLRVDTESTRSLGDEVSGKLRDAVRAGLGASDVILVADYAKGVLSEASLPQEVMAEARAAATPLCVDPKPENMDLFRGAWLVSPNEAEALRAAGTQNAQAGERPADAPPEGISPEIARAGHALRERLETEAVFVTMGDRGIAVFPRDRAVAFVPARRFDVPSAEPGHAATAVGDGTGCGDAASAASALAIAAGGSFREAAELANAAGGVVSRFVGVYSPTAAEVLGAFESAPAGDPR